MPFIINEPELVSYLRDPDATIAKVELIVTLANGLVGDEIKSLTEPYPTWVKILTLEVAERGWHKFAQESVDDWTGRRAAAVGAMALSEAEILRLTLADGRGSDSSAYSIQVTSPLDVP